MTDSKPWYLSRTIWAAGVTIAASAGGLMGVSVVGADQATLTDAIMQGVTAIAGIVTIVGRLFATSRLR